jgi:hypothetical protein
MIKLARNGRKLILAGLAAVVAFTLVPAAAAADATSYVLFSQGNNSTSMSGTTEDIERARELRAGTEALLYVRTGGAAYVIRDPATLRQARAIFAPQEALGARQAELGSRQAELGARQAMLGAEQAKLGARQAQATPREAAALGEQQAALGDKQGALGEQQAALGRQQDELGRQQSKLAEQAHEKFRALVADALRRGVAQRVN